MKKILFIGNVDKRYLVYPLARALNINGKVAIVSDDKSALRLINTENDYGNCGNIGIAYDLDNYKELLAKLQEEVGEDFDYVLIMTHNKFIDDANYIVYCRSNANNSILPEMVLDKDNYKDIPSITVTITNTNPNTKKTPEEQRVSNVVLISPYMSKYVFNCEERKEILEYGDKSSESLCKLFSQITDIDEKILIGSISRKEVVEPVKKTVLGKNS